MGKFDEIKKKIERIERLEQYLEDINLVLKYKNRMDLAHLLSYISSPGDGGMGGDDIDINIRMVFYNANGYYPRNEPFKQEHKQVNDLTVQILLILKNVIEKSLKRVGSVVKV